MSPRDWGGWQETDRLREIQKQILAASLRKMGRWKDLLALMRGVIADEDQIHALRQEQRDVEEANATRELSFRAGGVGRPCIGPVCFQARCMRLAGTGPCWVYEQKRDPAGGV